MSIASEITRLQTAKANLKTSLEAKGATIASDATIDTYPTVLDDIPVCTLQDKEVSVSGGTTLIEPDQGYTGLHSVSVTAEGGGAVEEKDVNFFDYDGTLVASYDASEVAELTDLPDGPDHSTDEVPLTFDEWNWTLAQIKAYNTGYPNAIINVGATYHTTDGKNHFYFNITSDNDGYGVEIALQGYSQGDTVDWGDGSAIETISSTTLTHIYTSIGEYHCIVASTSTYYNIGGSSSTRRSNRGKLTRAYLSNKVTSIKASAFRSCYNLQSITIPNSVTSIGVSAFQTCYSLKSINIPNTVTSIESNAFNNCYSLQSITIPNSVTSIGYAAFVSCYSLQSTNIPSDATSIGDTAFQGCYSLKSITIPSSVTIIGSGTFQTCNSLQLVTISSGVTSVRNNAFNSCYSLQSVTIPNGVTSIENNAFYTCYSLYSVTIEAITPPTLGTTVFNTSYQKKIYVPYSADHSVLAAYKSATNWSNFASIMEELPQA